ncbi:MAG: hypothetical protein COA50_12995 [Flavobacteriaceae bacterium]|nr:MAG: hypothetical protein COA50_12995 [Flavobacteriaceae bacterium]
MVKSLTLFFLIMIVCTSNGQEVQLPVDFRQHNLAAYNSSLFSPVFSLYGENAHAVALWSRWQWQTIDGDPSTFLINYTGQLNEKSAIGAGFFQHNTGTFLQTGGILNFAYNINLGTNARIGIGTNIIGFNQELAGNIFQPDPNIQLPQLENSNQFVMQFAPGIQLSVDGFRIGVSSENLIVISKDEPSSPQEIYLVHSSYDFPLALFSDGNSYIRPSIYIKSIPSFDTQFGLNTLFSTSKFWAQTGYNSFYGISVGAGAKLFKQLSIGALVEFGTDASIGDKDASFEIVSRFSFGKQKTKEDNNVVVEEVNEDILKELAKEKEKKSLDSIASDKQKAIALNKQKVQDSIVNPLEAAAKINGQKELEQERIDFINAAKLAKDEAAIEKAKSAKIAVRKELKQKRKDSINAVRLAKIEANKNKVERTKTASRKELKQKRIDSTNAARLAIVETAKKKAEEDKIALQKALEQKRVDSINAVKLAEVEAQRKKAAVLGKTATFEENKSKTKGHYEEVESENAQLPGYYLIANIFGTKRYFESFMKTLKDKGLAPGSLYRNVNKYNYVYLQRYDTIDEAERARINKFNGRYPDRMWILRIK